MPRKASKAKQRSPKPSTRGKKRTAKKKKEVVYKYDKVLEEGLAKIADAWENMFR